MGKRGGGKVNGGVYLFLGGRIGRISMTGRMDGMDRHGQTRTGRTPGTPGKVRLRNLLKNNKNANIK